MIIVIVGVAVVVAVLGILLGMAIAKVKYPRYVELDPRIHIPEFGGAWKACRDAKTGAVVYFDHKGDPAITIRRFTSGATLAAVFKHHTEVLQRS